jgi:hypothetical protein
MYLLQLPSKFFLLPSPSQRKHLIFVLVQDCFFSCLLMTDEAHFDLSSGVKTQYSRFWAEEYLK